MFYQNFVEKLRSARNWDTRKRLYRRLCIRELTSSEDDYRSLHRQAEIRGDLRTSEAGIPNILYIDRDLQPTEKFETGLLKFV